jgi:predicted component of type VI protein secretion system
VKETNAMADQELEKIVDKLQKLRALRHARERVRQLERELNGEPPKPESTPRVPEFLKANGPLRVAK